MVLSQQVEWALHCAVVLAGLPPGKTLSAKVLSEFHGIPKEYLSKALQSLANAGLILGVTGPRGGYALSRPASTITFLEIVEALEGTEGPFICREIRKNNPCRTLTTPFHSVCKIAKVMGDADKAWRSVLQKTTLLEILKILPTQVPPDLAQRSALWLEQRSGSSKKEEWGPGP